MRRSLCVRRGDDSGAKADVGDEMAIHDVQVEVIRAAGDQPR